MDQRCPLYSLATHLTRGIEELLQKTRSRDNESYCLRCHNQCLLCFGARLPRMQSFQQFDLQLGPAARFKKSSKCSCKPGCGSYGMCLAFVLGCRTVTGSCATSVVLGYTRIVHWSQSERKLLYIVKYLHSLLYIYRRIKSSLIREKYHLWFTDNLAIGWKAEKKK